MLLHAFSFSQRSYPCIFIVSYIWGRPSKVHVVYPPCDTSGLQQIPLKRTSTSPLIVSIAQFRPEKDHMLQLKALSILAGKMASTAKCPRLMLIGGCRNSSDEKLVAQLKVAAEGIMYLSLLCICCILITTFVIMLAFQIWALENWSSFT